ncbi:MAG: Flagellar biosynthesis protein FlhA, partial [uncultured Sphingomonas sp.]
DQRNRMSGHPGLRVRQLHRCRRQDGGDPSCPAARDGGARRGVARRVPGRQLHADRQARRQGSALDKRHVPRAADPAARAAQHLQEGRRDRDRAASRCATGEPDFLPLPRHPRGPPPGGVHLRLHGGAKAAERGAQGRGAASCRPSARQDHRVGHAAHPPEPAGRRRVDPRRADHPRGACRGGAAHREPPASHRACPRPPRPADLRRHAHDGAIPVV